METVSKYDNYLNFKILQERDYLKDRSTFNEYIDSLLGYCEGLDINNNHKGVVTQWFKLLNLEPDDEQLKTHPTLPAEIECVFELLDWKAILNHVSTWRNPNAQVAIIDPFAGLENNIERGMQLCFLEGIANGFLSEEVHDRVCFISNDKKVTGVDSLNPAQNSALLLPPDKGARIFFFSAPYLINDVAINYFAYLPNLIVVAQIRDDFLSRNNVQYRHEGWFKKLWDEQRVLIVTGGPLPFRTGVGQQKWLFIFSNKKHTVQLFKPSRKYRMEGWPIMEQVGKTALFKRRLPV